MKNNPNVVHPKHYNKGRFEVWDVIVDWKLDWLSGDAVKYIARAPHKGNEIQDLEKAIAYLRKRIETLQVSRGADAAYDRRASNKRSKMKKP